MGMAQNSSGDAFGFRGRLKSAASGEGERLENSISGISPAEAAARD
jgi:hypothetical protein